jgi:hypothetical protein
MFLHVQKKILEGTRKFVAQCKISLCFDYFYQCCTPWRGWNLPPPPPPPPHLCISDFSSPPLPPSLGCPRKWHFWHSAEYGSDFRCNSGEIPRNSAEFRGISPELRRNHFRSQKIPRNSESAEFRGHPNHHPSYPQILSSDTAQHPLSMRSPMSLACPVL